MKKPIKYKIVSVILVLVLFLFATPINTVEYKAADNAENEYNSITGGFGTIGSSNVLLCKDPTGSTFDVVNGVSPSELPETVAITDIYVEVWDESTSTVWYRIDARDGDQWPEKYADYHYVYDYALDVENTAIVEVSGEIPTEATLAVSPVSETEALLENFGLETSQVNNLALDIRILVEGEEWQPAGDVTVTINSKLFSETDDIGICHLLDNVEAVKAAETSGKLLIGNNENLIETYPTESEVAKKAGYDNAIAFNVLNSSEDKVTVNEDGSFSFVTDSFSVFWAVNTTLANRSITEAGSYTLCITQGGSATLTFGNNSSSVTITEIDGNGIVASQSSQSGRNVIFSANGAETGTIGEFTITWGSNTATVYVMVLDYNSALFCYGLIPGKTANSEENADKVWFSLGLGTISDEYDRSSLKTLIGNTSDIDKAISAGDITEPNYFPNLEFNGKTYIYTDDLSAVVAEERGKYYTVEWFQVVVANGANAGNNNFNIGASSSNTAFVSSNTNAFHMDGTIILGDWCNVSFHLKDAGSEQFAFYLPETYSSIVAEGTSESALKKPVSGTSELPSTKVVDGFTYEFDGWYTDQACTQKTNFTGTITQDTKYYAQYKLVTQEVTVTKVWDDESDKNKLRPASVIMTLTGSTDDKSSVVKESLTFTSDDASEDSNVWVKEVLVPVTYNGKNISYTVTENQVDNYTASINGLTVTNSLARTSLTINKKTYDTDGNEADYKDIDPNQTFIFNVAGTDENTNDISITVTIHGNGSVTVADLPIGSYTVTEQTNWSWRYTPESESQNVTVTSHADSNTVTFNNTRTEQYWLDGDNYKVNNFTGSTGN